MEKNVMEKMKKVLLSLCILGGLATAVALPQMYAQEEATSTLSASEKQSIYNDVCNAKNFKFLPPEIRKNITPDSIVGKIEFLNFDNDGPVIIKDDEKGYFVYFNEKAKQVILRRTLVREESLIEPFDKRGPNINMLPLQSPLVARVKKEASAPEVESMLKFGAALNAVLNDAYYLPLFKGSDVKQGKHTGKIVITPAVIFDPPSELTQDMTPEEIEIAQVIGLPMSSLKKLMDEGKVTHQSNSADCSGWNDGGAQINNSSVAGTLVFNAIPNAFSNDELISKKLSAVYNNLKTLKENLHTYAQSKGVDVEADAKTLKGYTTEQIMLWQYTIIVDNHFEDLMGNGKPFARLRDGVRKGKVPAASVDFRKMLKAKYTPVKAKRTAMNNALETNSNIIQKSSLQIIFPQSGKTYTA